MRKNSPVIVLCLAIGVFMAGCSDGQTVRVGDLIENRSSIDSLRIAEVVGPNEVMSIQLGDPAEIAAVMNAVDGVPVKRLSAEQDNEFMTDRILERYRSIEFGASGDSDRTVQGWVMVWPDGSIYVADVESMASAKRTISYLSEAQYPEVYNELFK